MVPDLTGLPQAGSREYWALWIGQGKEGSLMPGFARSAGGPLTEEQIQSLVDYLSTRKTEPEPANAPATRP
jgi:mono/diheme cytochrome c family protein